MFIQRNLVRRRSHTGMQKDENPGTKRKPVSILVYVLQKEALNTNLIPKIRILYNQTVVTKVRVVGYYTCHPFVVYLEFKFNWACCNFI